MSTPWLDVSLWLGVGVFSKVVATFNHVDGFFNLFMATTGDVWIIPFIFNLGVNVACWAHFMCHHELWPTSVSHPVSSFNSSLGFAGGKHYQKITIPIFRLVLQNVVIPVCFPYILSLAIFSPHFLLVGLLLQSLASFQSREIVKNLKSL